MTEVTELKQALTTDALLAAALRDAGTGAKGFRDAAFLPNLENVLEIPSR